MTTNATTLILDRTPRSPQRSFFRILAEETRCELLKAARMPGYTLPTLLFPAGFYLLFGVAFGSGQVTEGSNLSTYLLATYGAAGVMGAVLFGLGAGLPIERGQGWMLLKRASPMPASAYFIAKIVTSLVFGAIVIAVLFALGFGLGHATAGVAEIGSLTGVLIAGALPFCALALLIGVAAGPNSAPGIVQAIFLPMCFTSGLWLPIDFLPSILQRIAQWLPGYHYGQLALKTLGADRGEPTGSHIGFLAIVTVLLLCLAAVLYWRDDGRTWG